MWSRVFDGDQERVRNRLDLVKIVEQSAAEEYDIKTELCNMKTL